LKKNHPNVPTISFGQSHFKPGDILQSKPHDLLFMTLIVIHDIAYDKELSLFSRDRPKKPEEKVFIHIKMFSMQVGLISGSFFRGEPT